MNWKRRARLGPVSDSVMLDQESRKRKEGNAMVLERKKPRVVGVVADEGGSSDDILAVAGHQPCLEL